MPFKDAEERREYHRRYYARYRAENAGAIVERQAEWFQENKSAIVERQRNQRRRARASDATGALMQLPQWIAGEESITS